MAKLAFQLDGQAEVTRRIEAYGRDVARRVGQVVAEYALKIEASAKQMAPVDTGNLRANVRSDLSRALTDYAADINSEAAYSSFVEFGTSRMSAQPFLFPALEAHRTGFVRAIREATR